MTRILTYAALICLANVTASLAQEQRGVIYNFTATWCGPCQQMAPIVERLQREGIPIVKVDIDQDKTTSARFQITSVPTFVLVVDGKEVNRQSGGMSENQLRGLSASIPRQTTPEATPVSQPNPLPSLPINLGTPAPLIRSTPAPLKSPGQETRVAEADPKRGIMDMLSLGRKDKPAEGETVVRGNDSMLGQAEPFPGSSTTSHASTSAPANTAANAASGNEPRSRAFTDNPMHSTVRIRVFQNGVIEYGTGTLITSEAGYSRILTCGHIFLNFGDDSRIEVDVFEHGKPVRYDGRMITFSKLPDLGLISIENKQPLPVSRVAPIERIPVKYEKVSSIGCSQGQEPTREQIQVNDIDRFDGPSTYLCSGAPEKGRSGGGLFNAQGEVIGVCSSCDKDRKQGLYDGLTAIHSVLKQNSLENLYKSDPQVELAASQGQSNQAATPAGFETASSNPFGKDDVALMPYEETESTSPSTVHLPMEVSSGSAEVVVFIRNEDPTQSRVVILHQASPKFMSYLNGELPDGIGSKGLLGSSDRLSRPSEKRFVPTTGSQIQTPKKYTRQPKEEAVPQ